MATRGLRTLKQDGSVYHWRVYHRHRRGAEAQCAEVFVAYLKGFARAPLRVIFPEGQGYGPGWPSQSGVVVDYREPRWSLLLHRPRNAAILVGLGHLSGWDPRADARHQHVVENGYDFLREQPEALARMLADDDKKPP